MLITICREKSGNQYFCQNFTNMKRILTVFAVAVLLLCTASCHGKKHSKAYNEAKKVLEQVIETVNQAETCEDLDAAAWGILGVLGVEGLDAMPEDEQKQIAELTDKLSTLVDQKNVELNCSEEDSVFFGDDEEVPFDEPVEEAE